MRQKRIIPPRPRSAVGALLLAGCMPWIASASTADPGGATPGPFADGAAVSARRIVAELSPAVERLRGLAFARPVETRLIDEAGARRHAIERLWSFQAPQRLAATERAYVLLRLLPPGTDILRAYLDVLEEQAGGFYDPAAGSLYLLDDMPEALLPLIAVHELTHALEDQRYDLDGRLREVLDDDDRLFARGAIHEGSATLLGAVWLAGAAPADRPRPGGAEGKAAPELPRATALEALPPALRRQLLGPYVLGAAFLARGEAAKPAAGGYPFRDVERAYADGPSSSEQILHPEKYWDPARRDEPRRVRFADARRILGRSWRLEAEGVLGELTLGVLVGAPTPSALEDPATAARQSWSHPAVEGWDGDRWQLWARRGRRIVIFGSVWDGEADAEEFATAIARVEGLQVARTGERVAVLAGDAERRGPARLERVLRALRVEP